MVELNYRAVTIGKGRELCRREEGCSGEFCNLGRRTVHDEEIVVILVDLLTVVYIAADLKDEYLLEAESRIIELYLGWQRGSGGSLPDATERMFRMVYRLEVRVGGSCACLYFSVPLLGGGRERRLEEKLSEEMGMFRKDKYFDNLHKLSFFVEEELERPGSEGQDFLLRHYQSITGHLQYLLIAYLMAVCFLVFYVDLHS